MTVQATTLVNGVCVNSLHVHTYEERFPLFNFNIANDCEETELERKHRERKRTEEIRAGWKPGKHNTRKPWEK